MSSCVNCGVELPESHHHTTCSVCYGDPYYGTDGLLLQQMEAEQEEHFARSQEES